MWRCKIVRHGVDNFYSEHAWPIKNTLASRHFRKKLLEGFGQQQLIDHIWFSNDVFSCFSIMEDQAGFKDFSPLFVNFSPKIRTSLREPWSKQFSNYSMKIIEMCKQQLINHSLFSNHVFHTFLPGSKGLSPLFVNFLWKTRTSFGKPWFKQFANFSNKIALYEKTLLHWAGKAYCRGSTKSSNLNLTTN